MSTPSAPREHFADVVSREKRRFPVAAAVAAARPIMEALRPVTERLICAGSMRRRRKEVGDIEILFIPKWEHDAPVAGDLFARTSINLADEAILRLEASGVLARRKSKLGIEAFGAKNKLMVHVESGIPVDLFASNEMSWWNYLVCRTGPKESNTRIATEAQKRGWKWNPYGAGFSRHNAALGREEIFVCESEAAVFQFVGLPYREPWERR